MIHGYIPTFVSTEIVLIANNKSLDVKDIINYIKRKNNWKILTKVRLTKAIREAYLLGRDEIKLEIDEPSVFDLLPKVKWAQTRYRKTNR